MTDLVTRLLLNTNQFDDNIRNSTKQVQSFQDVGKSVTSVMGKFAGVIGLSMGAMEAFNKTMNATQTTSDSFERITTQAASSVDYFFTKLSQGDFSNFTSGLKNAIKLAGDYADILDELASKSLFNDFTINNLETKRQIALNKAKDKTLSDDERNKSNQEAKQYQGQINERKKDLYNSNRDAFLAGARKVLAEGGFQGAVTDKQIFTMFDERNRAEREKQVKDFDRRNRTYNAQMNKHITVDDRGKTHYDAEYYKIKKQRDAYNSDSYGKLNKVLNELPEEVLQPLVDLNKIANNQLTEISTSQLELHNTDAKINGSWKKKNKKDDPDSPTVNINTDKSGNKAVKAEEVINPGSLDEINKQLADARKKYNAAATDELRQELFKVVEDLEARKIRLEFVAKYGEMKDVKPAMAGLLSDNTNGTDFSKITTKPLTDRITKKDVKVNNEFADSLNLIGNIMGNLSGIMSDNAQEWTNFASTVLNAVVSAIPAIQSLAMAEGIEQSQKMPFPANLLALTASVTAIIGAFAQVGKVKKMAEGGLVYGNSVVNVGEYAGASSNPEVIAPLNKLKNLIRPQENDFSGGNVTFEIEGRKLVGVLNNYNKQQNRIK